ncbi:MAG: hypothetical protein ACOYD4_17450 [Solirubrobacterales bacterium]
MKQGGGAPLRQLSEVTGRDFPNLLGARERTAAGLSERRASIGGLEHSRDASVVLMGSWGRAEVTIGSDDDFMVLVHGPERSKPQPSVEAISGVLDHAPGSQGIFAAPVFSENLVQNIGLDADDNRNLTRRMLFLLESTPVSGDDVHRIVRREILDRYLDESVKPYRPPRFLLNDVVRYWRTICVDFAGKEWEGPDKWGLRNAKLRTARKVLFAGGFLPVLECFRFDRHPMRGFVEQQLAMPPIDRIACAFLENHASDEGARALGAYDDFVGRMNDQAFRRELQSVTRETADVSTVFSDVRRIGNEMQAGLLALLYESSRELSKVVRDYAIF